MAKFDWTKYWRGFPIWDSQPQIGLGFKAEAIARQAQAPIAGGNLLVPPGQTPGLVHVPGLGTTSTPYRGQAASSFGTMSEQAARASTFMENQSNGLMAAQRSMLGARVATGALAAYGLVNSDQSTFNNVVIPSAMYGAGSAILQKAAINPFFRGLNEYAASNTGRIAQGLAARGFGLTEPVMQGGRAIQNSNVGFKLPGVGTAINTLMGAHYAGQAISGDPYQAREGRAGLLGLAGSIAGGAVGGIWGGLPGIGLGIVGGASAYLYGASQPLDRNMTAIPQLQGIWNRNGMDINAMFNPQTNMLQDKAIWMSTALDAVFGAAGPVVQYPAQLFGAPTKDQAYQNLARLDQDFNSLSGAYSGLSIPQAASLRLAMGGQTVKATGGLVQDLARGGAPGYYDTTIQMAESSIKDRTAGLPYKIAQPIKAAAMTQVHRSVVQSEHTMAYNASGQPFRVPMRNPGYQDVVSAYEKEWARPLMPDDLSKIDPRFAKGKIPLLQGINNLYGMASQFFGRNFNTQYKQARQMLTSANSNVRASTNSLKDLGLGRSGALSALGLGNFNIPGQGGGYKRFDYEGHYAKIAAEQAQRERGYGILKDSSMAFDEIANQGWRELPRFDYHQFNADVANLNVAGYKGYMESIRQAGVEQLDEGTSRYENAWSEYRTRSKAADTQRASDLALLKKNFPGGGETYNNQAKDINNNYQNAMQKLDYSLQQANSSFKEMTKNLVTNTKQLAKQNEYNAQVLGETTVRSSTLQGFRDKSDSLNMQRQMLMTRRQNGVISQRQMINGEYSIERQRIYNERGESTYMLDEQQRQFDLQAPFMSPEMRASGQAALDSQRTGIQNRFTQGMNMVSRKNQNRDNMRAMSNSISKYASPFIAPFARVLVGGGTEGLVPGLQNAAAGALTQGLSRLVGNLGSQVVNSFGQNAAAASTGLGTQAGLQQAMIAIQAQQSAMNPASAAAVSAQMQSSAMGNPGRYTAQAFAKSQGPIQQAPARSSGLSPGAKAGIQAGVATAGIALTTAGTAIAGSGGTGSRIAGTAMGAMGGAMTGAVLGSMIMPGIGTAIGAVAGALIGGAAAFFGSGNSKKKGKAYDMGYGQQLVKSQFQGLGSGIEGLFTNRSGNYDQTMKDFYDKYVSDDPWWGIKSKLKGSAETEAGRTYNQLQANAKTAYGLAQQKSEFLQTAGGFEGYQLEYQLRQQNVQNNLSPFSSGPTLQMYDTYNELQKTLADTGVISPERRALAQQYFQGTYNNQLATINRNISDSQTELGFTQRSVALGAQGRSLDYDQFLYSYNNFNRDSQRQLEQLYGVSQRTNNRSARAAELITDQTFNKGILDRQKQLMESGNALQSDQDQYKLSTSERDLQDLVQSRQDLQNTYTELSAKVGDTTDEFVRLISSIREVRDALNALT